MPNPKSYAWNTVLKEVVPIGEEVDVLTPGFQNPDNYQTDKVEAVLGGNVIPEGQFTSSWEPDFSHVHITNNTSKDWPPGETLYVTVAGEEIDGSGASALEDRVDTLEGQVADLETRVAALEAAAGGAARGGPQQGGQAQRPGQNEDHKKREANYEKPGRHQDRPKK